MTRKHGFWCAMVVAVAGGACSSAPAPAAGLPGGGDAASVVADAAGPADAGGPAAADAGAGTDAPAISDGSADGSGVVDGGPAPEVSAADVYKPDAKPVACAGAPQCLATGKPGCAVNGKPCFGEVAVVDGAGNPLDGATTTLIVPLGSVPLGATTDLEVHIRNDAVESMAAPLHIASVAFDYAPSGKTENAATGKVEFSCWDSGMEKPCSQGAYQDMVPDPYQPTLDQTQLNVVIVRFLHLDDQPRTAKLRLTFAGDPAWAGKEFVVPITTASGVAKLKVPQQLTFSAPGTQPLAIQNVGGAVLALKSATMKGSPSFQVAITGSNVPFDIVVSYAPLQIPAGQQIMAEVTYSGGGGSATLQLNTDDPAGGTTTVQLGAK